MKIFMWKIQYLFYRYILRNRYTLGIDLASQDNDYTIIVRTDKRGTRHIVRPQNNTSN